MATYRYVQNDTSPDITFTITRAGSILDLTGSTVRFKILDNTTGSRTNDAHATCTITNATGGICNYSFQSGDLPSAGSYSCDVEVTFPSTKVETYNKVVTIVARAEA